MGKWKLIGLSVGGVVALSVALTGLDAVVEAGTSVVPGMIADFIDRLAMIGTMVAAVLIALRIARLSDRAEGLENAVASASDESRAWRRQSRRFLDGLSRAVEAQFEAWALSPAEADVAGLLLKGASLREIAILRHTAEATIRQQAQNIYRKSGLSNRSELSAYFLEDLFNFSETELAPWDGAAGGRTHFDA